jgi:hypothetical protein
MSIQNSGADLSTLIKALANVLLIGLLQSTAPGVCHAAAGSEPESEDIARLISRGDIQRHASPAPGKAWLPLYQGNGRMGCCFGPWGLHGNPGAARNYTPLGETHLMHAAHRTRAKYNADYLLPLAAAYWQREPGKVTDYEQHQSFYDGTIHTRFRAPDYAVNMLSWIDPVHRDTCGLRIEVQGDCPPVVVAPLRHLTVHYGQKLEQSFEAATADGAWQATLQCLDAKTSLVARSSGGLAESDAGAVINLKSGRNDLLITIGHDPGISAEESLGATRAWWHRTWVNSGWLELPDDRAQQMWVRSVAYVLYSHNGDGNGESPPTGFSGMGWPFPFPIDNSFRQPLLLWTGQTEAARRWVENWHDHLAGWQAYTRRMWKHDGLMMPHVFPYGPFDGYHEPAPPNDRYYPLYNSGHMVRSSHYTAVMVNDPAWTHQYVEPLIRGAARFYLDVAEKKADGLWHFSVIPSIGMDEYGGVNQPDYICTLFSAEYVLRMAVQYGLDTDGRCAAILRDGVAYKPLLAPEGIYYANGGSGAREFGHQKHPDQFFPLVHVPLLAQPDEPLRRTYERRYELTAGANRPRFAGHTLGQFILASARMHDVEGWRKDWSQLQPSRCSDPDWVQICESTGSDLCFFVTSHGLFAQALLESVVSTWWGKLDLAACVPWPGRVRFGNLRTVLGVTASGEVKGGQGEAVLRAWKDTTLTYRGQTLSLKRGEQKRVPIGG